MYLTKLFEEPVMPEKNDRRRKYPEGEKAARLTISMPESSYEQLLEEAEKAGVSNASEFVRVMLTFWRVSDDADKKGFARNMNARIATGRVESIHGLRESE
jgi:hypothetical protein